MSQVNGVFVCNIKLLLYYHVSHGIYHVLSESKVICFLLKIYCVFFSLLFFAAEIYCALHISYDYIYPMYIEYIVYVIFGLFGTDTHIYLKAHYTDDLKTVKESFWSLKIILLSIPLTSVVSKIVLHGITTYLRIKTWNICMVLCTYTVSYFGLFTVIFRLQLVYMFLIFYFRVKNLRIRFQNNKVMWTRSYIQMYETIISGFKKFDSILKPLVSY